LEVATMKALSAAFAISFSGTELPTLAQRAENLVVGAPCGLMDQLTSFFGEPRKLLPILCQPDKIMEPIPLPPDVFFLGIDSGIRHSIGGSSYADVRCAAFMGYSMIAQAAGASVEDILAAIEGGNLSELPYHGYLCAISATEFEERYKQVLPEFMTGKDFLSLYSRTIDPVTTVDEATRYAIFNCASHPVYEHARVGQYVEYVRALPSSDQASREILLRNMGALMFQSHERYSRCGLGSERTDEIVTLAKERAGEGIFGAKITGGGNGGTVCLLAEGKKGKDAVRELHAFFVDKYKTKLAFFEM
jgi:galactokinase